MTYYSDSKRTQEIAAKIFAGWGMDSIHSVDGRVIYEYDKGEDFPLFTPQSTTYGDYCGAAYHRANQEALVEAMEAIEEERGIEIFRGELEAYGTHSILLYPRAFSFPEIREMLQAIADYPSLDDSAASEIEQELQNESWESYARSDFRAELENLVPEGYGCSPKYADTIGMDWLSDLPSLNPLDYPGRGWGDDKRKPWQAPEVVGPDEQEIIDTLTDEQVDELFQSCDVYPVEEGYGSFHWPLAEAMRSLDWEVDILPLLR